MRLAAGEKYGDAGTQQPGPECSVPGDHPRRKSPTQIDESVVPPPLRRNDGEAPGVFPSRSCNNVPATGHPFQFAQNGRGHQHSGAVHLTVDLLFQPEVGRERKQQRVRVEEYDRAALRRRRFTPCA
jgi:hypothetical protein